MKDKKLCMIVITIMALTIALSVYMVYQQVLIAKTDNSNANTDTIEAAPISLSLTEIMDKINGYWHAKNNSFNVTGFLKEDMTYTSFLYASEGGVGGKVNSYNYIADNIYNLVIMLNPRLMCSEEFCEEGATIGQMSEPEEITIKLDLSNIDNQAISINGEELIYLAQTFDEIEKKIYN